MENSIGIIKIRKRTASEWLVMFVLFLPFVQALISEFLGLSDTVKFLADAVLAFLMLKIVLISRNLHIGKHLHPFLIVIGGLFAYVTVSYFLNYQSIFYYLWGMRNYFRFYMAFIAYIVFLKWIDTKKWLELLDRLYILNFAVIATQFFLGYRQDHLGGIFGVQKGCNGGLLIFMAVIITRSVLLFMRNECGASKCLLFSFMGLLTAAFAELKFFFVIFICIVIMAAFMTKSSVKKTVFLVLCSALIIIFSTALSLMYDEFAGFLSFENLWKALLNPNYATKEDIGRFTAIPTISELFLTGTADKLMGIGLGNGDSSSLSVFNTPFFDTYGSLHYANFSYSFLYLETGILGLIIYTSFFAVSFTVAARLYRAKAADGVACQLAMIFSVICIALMFYNASLRLETAAYLAFFVLALPLISSNEAGPIQRTIP